MLRFACIGAPRLRRSARPLRVMEHVASAPSGERSGPRFARPLAPVRCAYGARIPRFACGASRLRRFAPAAFRACGASRRSH